MARTTSLLTALALAAAGLLLSLTVAAAPASAQATASGSCSGVTLTPASRTVRRGGQVLIEGTACGASASAAGSESVQIKIRKGKKWGTLASAQPEADGSFSVCASVRVPRNVRVARVQATSTSGASGSTTLRVGTRGASSCDGSSAPADSGSEEQAPPQPPPPPPPPPENPNPDCPISQPDADISSLTLPSSCTVVGSDTASAADPLAFWGKLDCVNSSRHQQVGSGGDPHPTGLGSSQGNGSFRRLTAFDGDVISSGERCEMGYNWHSTQDDGLPYPKPGPTVLYQEGQRRVTFASIRLPSSSDVNNPNWRNVLQMKQAQPYANSEASSVFELQVRGGEWIVNNNWNEIWSAPASQNTWTRFAFDITYSQYSSIGTIKIYVDLNGDGDAADANEQSPVMQRQTLKREVAGGPSLPEGASIPSHLRAGIYQNENYNCPSGCSVDIDNVQIVKA